MNSLTISLEMKFETIEKEFYQEKATVNYPNDYDFTHSPKTTILKEYPQEYIIGQNTPYYPIFTNENQEKYSKYLEYSKKFNNLVMLGI